MSTVAIPTRTVDQKIEALAAANRIRQERGAMKRNFRKLGNPAAFRWAEGLLAEPPVWLNTMKAYDFFMALPKYGRVKTTVLFRRHQISMAKTCGGLSERQRDVLLGVLRREGGA